LSEFELRVAASGTAESREVQLGRAVADFDQDGWTIAHALDRNEQTAWGIHPREGQSHQAIFELKEPLVLTNAEKLVFVLKQLHGRQHLIGRPRVSATDAAGPVSIDVLPSEIQQVLAVAAPDRSKAQRSALAAYYLKEKVARELAQLPKPSYVYAAAAEFEPDGGLKPSGGPRPVHILRRGEITKPMELAAPGALSCVTNLEARFGLADPENESSRRAALAIWLTDIENPLVWRSIVNRVWQYHFGSGIVETPNDFGRMGSPPSHPELLDWLAVWFRDDARGSLKQLHRLIVLSATYRQSSLAVTPKMEGGAAGKSSTAGELDAENRLLWRMNRTRLDAEQIRDTILQISGRLDLRMGGPSDYQFDLKPGIHVTPKVDYTKFDVDSAAGNRRGVYRFLFRTLPDPFMDALDCPAGDQLAPTRNASVTVQQALALWDNAFAARQAEHFAERLAREGGDIDRQVERAFALALGRSCTREERREFADYARRHGMANCCRLLFNSNEFIFVN
jgi:hypothetical protein